MKIPTNVILIMNAIKIHVAEILMELILVNANQVRALRTIETDNSATLEAESRSSHRTATKYCVKSLVRI